MTHDRRTGRTARAGLAVACAIAACVLAGCASKPAGPQPMTCVIDASAKLNPTAAGRPSPLLVRVYALKSAAAFTDADFLALYQHDAATLGADQTGKDEFTAEPGRTQSCSNVLSADTRYIGVLAAFRDIEHSTWRAVAPIEGGKRAAVLVHLDALRVVLTVSH